MTNKTKNGLKKLQSFIKMADKMGGTIPRGAISDGCQWSGLSHPYVKAVLDGCCDVDGPVRTVKKVPTPEEMSAFITVFLSKKSKEAVKEKVEVIQPVKLEEKVKLSESTVRRNDEILEIFRAMSKETADMKRMLGAVIGIQNKLQLSISNIGQVNFPELIRVIEKKRKLF